jgi:hypothetical protein
MPIMDDEQIEILPEFRLPGCWVSSTDREEKCCSRYRGRSTGFERLAVIEA